MPLGRLNEAVIEWNAPSVVDPLNFGMHVALINGLHAAGLDERAIVLSRQALETDPSRFSAHMALARIYSIRGQFAEALASAEKAYHLASWNVRVIALFAGILIQSGEHSRAQALVERLRAESGDGYGTPMALTVFYSICGETGAAADWFEKAIEQRDPAVVGYLRTPLMGSLQSSPAVEPVA